MKINEKLVKKIALLARLNLSKDEEPNLTKGFFQTIQTINGLLGIEVNNIEPIYQTTQLENVFREDKVEKDRTLSHEALSQAKKTYQGYFVVDQILEED
ncbi:MAG: Asp-tRNA(Asn)/Glu-tRNA(Gln) amidotransferase subunit GatC [Patescibacteria group bacterium]|nr:Asp-tRNA(Asn)/Glu-tRNA(Gln) amidotransferase subunit GatC [Patescibacteria group bacterium]